MNYSGGPDSAGQAQIGLPELQLASPLRAISRDPDNFFLIIFEVIEGGGSFELAEGSLFFPDVNACGNPLWFVEIDDQNRASVRFTPSTPMALVAIQGGQTDVFAVGPCEARFVQASAPSNVIPAVLPLGLAPDLDSGLFIPEVLVPSNFSGNLTADIVSLDECLQPLQRTIRWGRWKF